MEKVKNKTSGIKDSTFSFSNSWLGTQTRHQNVSFIHLFFIFFRTLLNYEFNIYYEFYVRVIELEQELDFITIT